MMHNPLSSFLSNNGVDGDGRLKDKEDRGGDELEGDDAGGEGRRSKKSTCGPGMNR
jgi:hypothetical protein